MPGKFDFSEESGWKNLGLNEKRKNRNQRPRKPLIDLKKTDTKKFLFHGELVIFAVSKKIKIRIKRNHEIWIQRPHKPIIYITNIKYKENFISGKFSFSAVSGKIIIRDKRKPWNLNSANSKTYKWHIKKTYIMKL